MQQELLDQDSGRATQQDFKERAFVAVSPNEAFDRIVQHVVQQMYGMEVCGMTDRELGGWVETSILLDLVYDESQKPDEDIRAAVWDKIGDASWKGPCPGRDAEAKEWFEGLFLPLKRIRVRRGLALEEQARICANEAANGETETFRKETDKTIRLHHKWTDDLDRIMWRCAAAIGSLRTQLPQEENSAADGTSIDGRTRTWATLLALFHVELCSSARPDMSLSTAYLILDSKWLREAAYEEYFRGVAKHIVATGENHTGRPLEAVRTLDTKIDVTDIFKNSVVNCDQDSAEVDLALAHRILYFPAVRTLAQSLGDLGRHVERRFYLTNALTELKAANKLQIAWVQYWKCALDLELHIALVDDPSGDNFESVITKECPWPRLEAVRRRALCSPKMTTSACKNDVFTQWKKSEYWLLGWHSAEMRKLVPHIRSMATEATEWLDDQRTGTLKDLSDFLVGYRAFLDNVLFDHKDDCPLKFLLRKLPEFTELSVKERDRTSVWGTATALIRILRELKNESSKAPNTLPFHEALEEWLKFLLHNLAEADRIGIFDHHRPAVIGLDFVPWRCENERRCPNTDDKCSDSKCIRFPADGCAETERRSCASTLLSGLIGIGLFRFTVRA